MSKKNKKGKKKKVKQKPANYKKPAQTVDERAKQAMTIKAPDEVPFKMDNEKRIDSFMRFNRRKKDKMSPKVEARDPKPRSPRSGRK